MKKFLIWIFISLISNSICLISQDGNIKESNFSFGAAYQYIFVQNIPDFSTVDTEVDCIPVNYSGSTDNGFRVGAVGTLRLSDRINFIIGFLYFQSKYDLRNISDLPYNSNNEIEWTNLINELSGQMNGLTFQIQFGYRLLDRLFLSAGISAEHHTDISGKKYIYLEESSEKKLQYVTQFSNTYDNKLLYFLPLMGISYDIVVGTNDFSLLITPSVSYEYGLYSFLKNLDWRYNTLSIGLSIRYSEGIY